MNVFVKPDEQRLSLLRLCHGEKMKVKPTIKLLWGTYCRVTSAICPPCSFIIYMKQTIITILIAFVAVAGQGQVRCHVIGTVAEGTTSIELRIYRDGEDPKNSTLRPMLKNGRFECDVEDAQIERWHIVDFGEVMEKGMITLIGAKAQLAKNKVS